MKHPVKWHLTYTQCVFAEVRKRHDYVPPYITANRIFVVTVIIKPIHKTELCSMKFHCQMLFSRFTQYFPSFYLYTTLSLHWQNAKMLIVCFLYKPTVSSLLTLLSPTSTQTRLSNFILPIPTSCRYCFVYISHRSY